MRNSRGGLGGIPSPGILGAPPAFARSRQAKAPGEVFGLKSSAIPAKGDRGLSDSAMVRSYSERPDVRHRRGRPMPLRPGAADHVQGRLVPRRGWKWWTCGNGGFPDVHQAAESHFQPICWKWEKSRETAISRFPRPFPRRLKGWTPPATRGGGKTKAALEQAICRFEAARATPSLGVAACADHLDRGPGNESRS